MKRHFITVDWCNKGQRGVFCERSGGAYSQEIEWTREKMWEVLDAFAIILNPLSQEFTEEEIKQYNQYRPLAEYKNMYGIAIKKEQ